MNRAILIGRCGKDPETRTIGEDRKVANFTLATSERWKDKGGESHEVTEWHNIVAWGNLAVIIESYVKKGDLLMIEGKIQTRSWDDKEGIKRYTTEINASNMLMLSPRKEERPQEDSEIPPPTSRDIPATVEEPDGDLPF